MGPNDGRMRSACDCVISASCNGSAFFPAVSIMVQVRIGFSLVLHDVLQHRRHHEDAGVEPGPEALLLIEIEHGDVPVIEPEPLLQSEGVIEVCLHGEYMNQNQDRH